MCLLAECAASFKENLVLAIRANEKRINQHLSESLMLVTALQPHVSPPAPCALTHACPPTQDHPCLAACTIMPRVLPHCLK